MKEIFRACAGKTISEIEEKGGSKTRENKTREKAEKREERMSNINREIREKKSEERRKHRRKKAPINDRGENGIIMAEAALRSAACSWRALS